MSAAKFMNILAQREQQYIENSQLNSYNQFKQTIQTLGFQQTQTSLLSFKTTNTPSTADNSPFYFSKQDQWQQQQDQLAQQQSNSTTRSYFAQYPNKLIKNIDDRYQQHNNISTNRILSASPQNLLMNKSISPNHIPTQIQQQLSSPVIKKSNLKIRTEDIINIKKKKTVKIIEYQPDDDKKQTNQSPNKIKSKTRIKTVQDYLGSNSTSKNK